MCIRDREDSLATLATLAVSKAENQDSNLAALATLAGRHADILQTIGVDVFVLKGAVEPQPIPAKTILNLLHAEVRFIDDPDCAEATIAHLLESTKGISRYPGAAGLEAVEPRLALLNSSQNGLRVSIRTAIKAKAGGMRRGFPDVFLPVPCNGQHGLFLEMKRKGGRPSDLSPDQRQWLAALREQGYAAQVAFGWEEAVRIILAYLGAVVKDLTVC